MIDVVIPSGNENEFIAMAQTLGIAALCFLDTKADLSGLQRTTAVRLFSASSSATSNSRVKIVTAGQQARHYLEHAAVDAVHGVEELEPRDGLHQRRSGLNHILVTFAAEKNKLIGFSFHDLLQLHGQRRSQVLGRIQQNVALCRKAKAKMMLASFAATPYEMRAPHDMIAVGQLIGMTAGEAKEAVAALEKKIQEKSSSAL
ncbi:hypothetical protein HYU19_05985 [Candidatus Woesearchaeota archaeon]|nr:hypothetical protein [Candidatus Woesearchaeota archaeon]